MNFTSSGSSGRLPAFLGVLAAALLIICPGCDVSHPQNKLETQLHAQEDVAVTREQARLRMRSMVDPMCGRIEQSADEIIAGTTDLNIQLGAMKWKIDGVPAMREALLEPDPGTAALDTVILCDQMANYFDTGPGKKELGPASAKAVAACRQMEDDFVQVIAAGTFSGDVSKVRAFAKDWAAQHPIRYSIADRESALTRAFERPYAEANSLGQQVAQIVTTMDDLNRKMGIYSDQLFRQARWEMERFRLELIAQLRVDEAIPLSERAVAMLQDMPRMIDSEREQAIKGIHDELTRENEFIIEQRVAALDQITKERAIALSELNDTITRERQQLSSDAEQITRKNVDYAVDRVTRLVIGVMAGMVLLALVVLFFARRMLVRRPA
jgi:hypothetical protein